MVPVLAGGSRQQAASGFYPGYGQHFSRHQPGDRWPGAAGTCSRPASQRPGAATWTWTFGILGAALRFLSRERPAVRYLADASYWIYIVHLPLLIVLQGVAAALVQLPWQVEYPAILAIAFALMIPSYHLLVRYTWLGAILNGRRMERPARLTKAKLQEA